MTLIRKYKIQQNTGRQAYISIYRIDKYRYVFSIHNIEICKYEHMIFSEVFTNYQKMIEVVENTFNLIRLKLNKYVISQGTKKGKYKQKDLEKLSTFLN